MELAPDQEDKEWGELHVADDVFPCVYMVTVQLRGNYDIFLFPTNISNAPLTHCTRYGEIFI